MSSDEFYQEHFRY